MTDDDILGIAYENLDVIARIDQPIIFEMSTAELIAFARLIADNEREACAKLCDRLYRKEKAHASAYGSGYWCVTAKDCASAIRSRGENNE